MLEKTEVAIKNRQYRDTDNIGHKGRRQTKQKTQHIDTGNIGHTRHRTKTNKTIKHNTETLATLGTQDTGGRQTKQ